MSASQIPGHEMIQNRFDASSPEGTEEDGLWPQEFKLEG